MPWKTFGHQSTKRILDLQAKAGRFAHAYLFSGPSGIGKKTLALEFAEKVLQTKDLHTHPDFSMLSSVGEIGVEQMRDFIAPLSFKPFAGSYKVAIIDNAELMNPQSSNALLKTLEEPSGNTILILISSLSALLPTIVSRCQTFSLNMFSPGQLAAFAREQELSATEEIIKASFGRIDRLRQLLAEGLGEQMKTVQAFSELTTQQPAERLLSIAAYAELETLELSNALCLFMLWQKQQLNMDVRAHTVLSALVEAGQQLQTNKNKKLILQDLFLKM